jgi:TolB-like protein
MADEATGDMAEAGKPSLFISYARADRPRVKPLADALIAAGYDVWWDALIDGGAAFAQTIESKLESADAVVVVWSATSIVSDWVRDEAAHGRDRKRLVPVTLDGVEPPLGFRQYHAINLAKWNGRRDAAELASLERGIAAAGSGGEPSTHTRETPKRGMSRRGVMLASGSIVAAAATGIAVWHPWQGSSAGKAVAVLPFANLSGDKGQDYFSEGLSEEVRAALVRIVGLKVAAPTSSNEFRDTKEDARSIAKKLGVGFLLGGSVRKAGEMVRIAATLTDASTGFTSWSQTFDRKLDDIFALQSEIADNVASALIASVAPSGKAPGGTSVVAAYDALLHGRALFNADAGEASDRAALAKFEEAITLDPRYAAAYAAKSRSLAAIASQYAPLEQLEALHRASTDAARRGVELAPDLAAAQLALGYETFSGLLDFRAARAPFESARTLGQGDADILVLFAFFAAKTGRADDAQRAISQAQTLDPLNPRTWRAEAFICNASGRYADAIRLANRALSMNARLASAHYYVGTAQFMLGNIEAARDAFALEPTPPLRFSGLGISEQKLGNNAQATAALDQLISGKAGNAVYQQAQIYAQWGNAEAAVAALDKARKVRDAGVTGILVDPMLIPLRRNPRYLALIAELGIG